MKSAVLIILILALQAYCIENEKHDVFFSDLKKKLVDEYHRCTGDTVNRNIDWILAWKKGIYLQTEAPSYKKILKEFIIYMGITENILPCEVLKWHESRIAYIHQHEDSLKNRILKKADSSVDSIGLNIELQKNPSSEFDFEDIPFGLSKNMLINLFACKYSYPLEDIKRYILAEHFHICGTPFLIKFYFTPYNRFYKYEIEGYGFSGDSLNNIVRPQSSLLLKIMEEKIGPADHIYRVGYFEIKSGDISPVAKWERSKHTVVVGLGIFNARYFAKAVVVNKEISDEWEKRKRVRH